MAGGRSRGPRSRKAGGGLIGGLIRQGVRLTWVPNLPVSPALLTGMLFPGPGDGMPCALEIITPLPWGRCGVWSSGPGCSLSSHLRSNAQGGGGTHQLQPH